jgi:cysteinyl-tRNA synthetase
VDLVFPHHEDEIAQSEAATGKTFARCWCHGEFLLTDGSKMAKRVGNVATVQDLRDQNVSPAALRQFFFTTHYRKQLNLSGEALESAGEAVRRVGDFAQRLKEAKAGPGELSRIAQEAREAFREAMFDDLNAPEALAALFTFIKKVNAELDRGGGDAKGVADARAAFAEMNGVLDIVPEKQEAGSDLSAWIEERITARTAARAARDFGLGDQIRDELLSRGVVIEDSPSGTRWKLK